MHTEQPSKRPRPSVESLATGARDLKDKENLQSATPRMPCDACRQSKIRCDQLRPKCTSCKNKTKDCIYSASVDLEGGRIRRFHHRSKNGCLHCKARRVRCDEKRPVCGNCTRMGTETLCTFPHSDDTTTAPDTPQPSGPSSRVSTPTREIEPQFSFTNSHDVSIASNSSYAGLPGAAILPDASLQITSYIPAFETSKPQQRPLMHNTPFIPPFLTSNSNTNSNPNTNSISTQSAASAAAASKPQYTPVTWMADSFPNSFSQPSLPDLANNFFGYTSTSGNMNANVNGSLSTDGPMLDQTNYNNNFNPIESFFSAPADLIPFARTTTNDAELYWQMSRFAQIAFLSPLDFPQPDPLAIYFPSMEQRQQYRHFFNETSQSLVVVPATTTTNPWLTRISHMALGRPFGQDIAHDAFRYALLSIATFDIGYRLHNSLANRTDNVMYATSAEQREEAMRRLDVCTEFGFLDRDDISVELGLATTLAISTRDRLAGCDKWDIPLNIAIKIIAKAGGPNAFINRNPSPTRRFLVEQMACIEILGCLTTFEGPKLLTWNNDWLTMDPSDDWNDHLQVIYGWDRSTVALSAQTIIMAEEHGTIEKLRMNQSKYPYRQLQEIINIRSDALISRANQFLQDAENSRQALMMKPLPPQVALGALAAHTVLELCVQLIFLGPMADSATQAQKKVHAILEIVEEAFSRDMYAGLLLPLSWTAACGKGANYKRAISMLQRLQARYHIDHGFLDRLIHFNWAEYEAITFDKWEDFLREHGFFVPVF